jgi:hypothetical protein
MSDSLLSPHFTRYELERSARALRKRIPNEMGLREIANAIRLCTNVLEPTRAANGALVITSGYRSEALNADMPGASETSSHRYKGLAAAVDCLPVRKKRREVVIWLQKEVAAGRLRVDQVIFEERTWKNDKGDEEHDYWIHISDMRADGAQRGQFKMTFDGKKYESFNPDDPRVLASPV